MATICITGAAGFVGTHLVKAFLEQGYNVHGTIRDTSNAVKTQHLWELAKGNSTTLRLFSADITVEGAFDEAVKGCEYVIHAASPVMLKARNPQKEIVAPALAGVRHIFGAIQKAKQAKRVIFLSSQSAIGEHAKPEPFTEADWNDRATLRSDPYALSKTVAEKLAWEIYSQQPAEGYRFELVALCPTYILGPVCSANHLTTSPSIVREGLNGDMPLVPRLWFGIVDVRDLAAMHVAVIENEKASGRYLANSECMWAMGISDVLRKHYPPPKYKVGSRWAPNFLLYCVSFFHENLSFGWLWEHLGVSYEVNADRARRELGISFRPAAQSIIDTAESLIAQNFVFSEKRTAKP